MIGGWRTNMTRRIAAEIANDSFLNAQAFEPARQGVRDVHVIARHIQIIMQPFQSIDHYAYYLVACEHDLPRLDEYLTSKARVLIDALAPVNETDTWQGVDWEEIAELYSDWIEE